MSLLHPAYQKRELERFMRPDAHRFLRPEWRRFVKPDSELGSIYQSCEQKYRPDQLRVPAGTPEGGRWADEGLGRGGSDAGGTLGRDAVEFSAAGRKRGAGHHYVPGAVIRKRGVSEEATNIFEKAKTGPLFDTRSNKWDKEHRIYSDAVGEALDAYLSRSRTSPDKMTSDQAREFLGKIFESTDLRIKNYNIGIQMREIMQRLLRRGGRE